MTAAGALDVVELGDLPSLDDEVTCEARNQPGDGALCGAAPVTHWVVFGCCRRNRFAVCAGHAVEVRRRWPAGLAVHLKCGSSTATVRLLPIGGGA